jgi:Transglutaminase-like superfamily
MWNQLQRFRALHPGARRLFLHAAVLLPMIRVSLHARGYKKTQEWLQKRLQARSMSEATLDESGDRVEMTCRMVRAAERHGWVRSTCLQQSLALWYLLGRQSISSRIRIGVRKQSDQFEAHAWVEHEGLALNQSGELHQHYASFDGDFPILPAEPS